MTDKPNKSAGLQCDSDRNASRFFLFSKLPIKEKVPIIR